jgi:hypothetical protein
LRQKGDVVPGPPAGDVVPGHDEADATKHCLTSDETQHSGDDSRTQDQGVGTCSGAADVASIWSTSDSQPVDLDQGGTMEARDPFDDAI